MTLRQRGLGLLGVSLLIILLGLWFRPLDLAYDPPSDAGTLHAQTGVAAGPRIEPRRNQQTRSEPDSDQQAPAEETWEVIHIGGQRFGYSHGVVRRFRRDGRTLVRTNRDTELTIKRFGQELKMQTLLATEETEDGRLLSYEMEIKNPPAGSTKTVGRVEADGLHVKTTVAGNTTERTIRIDDDVKSPAWQDRVTRHPVMKRGETRSFPVYLPELNQVKQVKLMAEEYDFVKLLEGRPQKLLRVRITQPGLPAIRAFLNEQGEPLKTETGLLGQTMETYIVSKEEALKAIAGTELDIAVNTLIRVSRIRNAHHTKQAVYRITTQGEDPAEFLLAGPTQHIKRISPDTVELTVTAVEVPKSGRRTEIDSKYLESTRFLQCDDDRVQQHARRAAAGATDPAQIAVQMERYVHEKLTKKNFSTALASAAEVAKSLEGDCTEHAVLLAAMLRADHIPSRIAVGLVYVESRSSFGGHMWTEAYLNGRWVPLDATLGQGGIGAAHIKLGESSFSDNGPAPITSFLPLLKVLGNMQIRVMDYDH